MPIKKPKAQTAKPKSKSGKSAAGKHYLGWLDAPTGEAPQMTDAAFTKGINWKIFRIMAEFIEGFEFLSKLKKEVTIFGSARSTSNNRYYKIAKELGYKLGKKGYTVITGGGPGMMEAANWGATEAGAESVGLDIELTSAQRRNQFVSKAIGFHYFFTRKVMLSASAQAYIYFPGGFGTMDEMTEMVTLIQTNKIPRNVPVILVGKDFWTPFLDWVNRTMCEEQRFIDKEEVAIMQVVDTADEAIRIIDRTRERPFG
ncbi:TIGR00730 family Rossman fold protein [Candidatus Uhrbacteria bacterium]|nr:TIGR00730 family Rossman fold protein [Candidatus Uhrbacteria bacterium]